MRRMRLIPTAILLLLIACRSGWSTTAFDDLGLRLERPAAWSLQETDGGLLLGSDQAVIDALRADAIIAGGGAAITVEPIANLRGADAIELVSLVLDNFGDLGSGRWQLTQTPAPLQINGVTGAQATLTNATAGEAGWVTIRVLTGDTLAVFIILIDTTPDGAHQESLLRIADSAALLR